MKKLIRYKIFIVKQYDKSASISRSKYGGRIHVWIGPFAVSKSFDGLPPSVVIHEVSNILGTQKGTEYDLVDPGRNLSADEQEVMREKIRYCKLAMNYIRGLVPDIDERYEVYLKERRQSLSARERDLGF